MNEKSISDFASENISKLNDLLKQEEQKVGEFLLGVLGNDYKLITSIAFDNDAHKFYDIKAPEHIIKKLRDAGYARD